MPVRLCILGTIFWGVVFFFSRQAPAQHYVWPTNASHLLTSSFCEFRPRHYHAAIDIKTWNTTGYRAFAVADGYVMRVRVSAFGYGKAVYLKLKDGNVAIYAHLERFWPALEKYVDRIRRKRKQYRVDLHLRANQFPVRQGQIVGYTGSTGIGVPHLHFELRNTKNQPINPLTYYRNRVKDQIAPTLYQAALIPLAYNSLVNFSPDTVLLDLHRQKQVSLPDTFYLSGKVGLALKVYDRANGAPNRFGFYRARMWVDDSLVYTVQYDRFSYAQSKLVELDANFSLWRKGLGVFHNFYRHPANTLPNFGKTPPGGGILDSRQLPGGLHRLRIEVEDFWQNRASFQMHFYSGTPRLLDYDLNRWLGGELFLRIKSPVPLKKFLAEQYHNPHGWQPINRFTTLASLETGDGFQYTLSLTADSSRMPAMFKIRGISADGFPTTPLFFEQPVAGQQRSESTLPQWQEQSLGKDWISLKATVPSRQSRNFIRDILGSFPAAFILPGDPGVFRIHLPVADVLAKPGSLPAGVASFVRGVKLCDRRHTVELVSEDRLFGVRFTPGAFYAPAAVRVRKLPADLPAQIVEPPYQQLGAVYRLQPFDQPVNEAVQVSLTIPDSLRHLTGLGLYYLDKKNGWSFLSSSFDSSRFRFTSTVTSLEKFTLIQDTVAPIVLPAQKIRSGKLLTRNGYLTFVVKDEMSGIRNESQIKVLVDGQWHLFDFDPEEDTISFRIASAQKGNAKVTVTVFDNIGNKTEKEYRIR